ncbi:AI-2E family transporter [Actinomycetospora lutea]|uniref:AI-2E family transporter n=1 Tax=Actinomycetospora lutea TaxID=663604 RepID=UPI0023653ED9|nr:AI-2E family transporter [Actinomycetospora lutea]MDD7938085.1 AI-2E family transporter [Actinomycetospora lutea]
MILLGAAAVVVIVAGMFWSSWLSGPLLLALVIVIAVYPVKTWLQSKGWPAWATVLSLIVVIYGSLLVLLVFLAASVSQLSALLAENSGKSQQLVNSVTAALQKVGVTPGQSASTAGSANLSKFADQIGAVLANVGSLLSSLVFILALMLFLTAESGGTARRMDMISRDRPHMVTALEGFVRGTRSYLVVTAVFGLIVAVLDTAALAIMGIPLAVLWGVLAFLTNFVPNVGFIIGLVPPALVALLLGGWQLALAVVVVYCVLNVVIQSLIQPRFVGDSVGLSATVTFLALLFWAWVLGPLGALLAIPMTLLIKAVLVDADPRAQWVEALLGAEPSAPKEKKVRRKHAGNGQRPETADVASTSAP